MVSEGIIGALSEAASSVHNVRMGAHPADGFALGGQFPPIREYGFLSDCETTALVAPNGAVEWLCLPRMDSPSVFGAILDRDAGTFRIAPTGVEVPSARRYIPGTLVLETTWWAPGGWLVVTDALLDALEQGRVRAALDVTDPEPLPEGHPLWAAPDVLITPHLAGVTAGLSARSFGLIRDQLRRYRGGRPLLNVVEDY